MRRRLVTTVVLLAAIAVLGGLAQRQRVVADLTAERTLTLTVETGDVVDRLDRRVEITAFLRRDEPGRVEAAALLDRYRKLDRRITWRVLDPDASPGELARLGVDPVLGGVAVQAGDEVELAATPSEQDLTAALARVVRGRDIDVCVTEGHGEPALGGSAGGDLGSAAALLEREGYRLRPVDLLSDPVIPEDCSVLVVAGPTEPLGPAMDAVVAFAEADGRLLVLADPLSAVDLAPLLDPVGLGLQRGIVFEADPEAVVGGDVTAPIVRRYASGHPIVRRLAPTYFPGVQEVFVDETAEDRLAGLTISRLADTSELSYLETAPVEAIFDPAEDRPGPVTVAAAADVSRNEGGRISRARTVVIGDRDFVTNAFVGEAANAALLARAVGWLSLEEDLLAISPNLPSDRPLRLTDGRVAYARLLTVGGVPLLFLLAGALVWALRRGR